jgi:hypothetical protein
MTLARLLAVTLLVSSVSASAQGSKLGTSIPGNLAGFHHLIFFDFLGTAATQSEPWRLIPKQPVDPNAEKNPLRRIGIDQYEVYDDISLHDTEPPSYFRGKSHWPDTFRSGHFPQKPQQDADTTCYSIRSYVVARDSKDSDSTHPAGYSTCQPTNRYRLKSTEIRVDSPDR